MVAEMETDEPQTKPALFAQCSFVIVKSGSLDHATSSNLLETVKLHGGDCFVHSNDDASLSLEGITHVISTTSDFPAYHSACDVLIPVIKPGWVDASLAKDKLANPRQYNPDPRLFMSDVVVCCADLPEGDADAIIGGVLAMGGLFSNKIASQVTHVVALTLDSEKCAVVQSRKLSIKIVLPHWFDDCLKLGRRIDEQPYLLPNPEILQHNDNPPRGADSKHVTGAIYPDPSQSPLSMGPRLSTGRKLTVFKKKNIMLASDLGIGSHLRGILEGLIVGAGGKLTTTVSKSDMFVCKYREGQDYRLASKSGKDVGNLAWLYYLITNNAWTSPLNRLLHYPVARQGLPGFKDLRISLSNYSGEARVYLENLINAAGAECTKTLKQDNTHLITAHIQSEKCSAAKDWGIHLINHLWLEESYAKWRIQSVTDTRYTHFPRRTNLGEVVGQTKVDRSALEQNFFPDDDVEMTDALDLPRTMQPKDRNNIPPPVQTSSALNSPNGAVNFKNGRKAPGKRPKDVGAMGEQDNYRTPAASRFVALGKENETPTTTGSRKSKDAATARLHELTPDIALYEKEKKRVGGVVYGGRRKSDEDRIVQGRKRSFDEASDTEDSDEVDFKKVRKGVPAPSMHLLISGYKKWVGRPKVEEADKKQLRNLGIIVTTDPGRATHLAAPGILRTQKFVVAMSYAPTIISTKFIDACLERDNLLDADDFALQDKANEKKMGVSLALSRGRAKENRHQLLHGRTIYCMENIHGGFETFKSIVEANGGECNQYRGRPGTRVPSRRADSEVSTTDDDAQNEVYLISGPEKENFKLWARFRQMAEGSRKVPKIVSPDWLLEIAMCQKILPVGKHELRETV